VRSSANAVNHRGSGEGKRGGNGTSRFHDVVLPSWHLPSLVALPRKSTRPDMRSVFKVAQLAAVRSAVAPRRFASTGTPSIPTPSLS